MARHFPLTSDNPSKHFPWTATCICCVQSFTRSQWIAAGDWTGMLKYGCRIDVPLLLHSTLPFSSGQQPPRFVRRVSSITPPPKLTKLTTPEENSAARAWIDKFKSQEIPKSLVELTFSRSSGPGGQVLVIYDISSSADADITVT